MAFPYIFGRMPLADPRQNAALAGYQRTLGPDRVWVGGRGGYMVQRSLNSILPAGFSTVPIPVKDAVNADGLGWNGTPGSVPLIKRNG